MPQPNVTQVINEIQMYVTHYSLFEEPDAGIPAVLYIDAATGKPEPSMNLAPPIATQVFARHGHELGQLSANFKTMPYAIAPFGLAPPITPEVVGFFQSQSPTITAADIRPVLVAVGTFILPQASSVTGSLKGARMEVTKEVHFRVQVRIAYVADKIHLGLLTPLVSNIQGANFFQPPLPIPPTTDPFGPLTYDWGARLTLSTENSYARATATEPKPFADPFSPDLKTIEMKGARIDAAGKYTIVGAAQKPHFMASPTSSVPAILEKLFGSVNLTDCELAYLETGTLVGYVPDDQGDGNNNDGNNNDGNH